MPQSRRAKRDVGSRFELIYALLALAQTPADIVVNPDQVLNRITPAMYGSCIEDVNHEIYGGLYAQRIFGESFEEPAVTTGPAGWRGFGGNWTSKSDEIHVDGGDGPQLVLASPVVLDGTVEARVRAEGGEGNAALMVRVSNVGLGADNFDGYEIGMRAGSGQLILGRHRHDFHLLSEVPAPVGPREWHRLRAVLAGARIQVFLDDEASPRIDFTDPAPILSGGTALRTWHLPASYRDVFVNGKAISPTLNLGGVSGMWDPIGEGLFLREGSAYNSRYCQKIVSTHGVAGVANRGLNRSGIAVRKGLAMDGRIYLHGNVKEAVVALQSADGTRTYATQRLPVTAVWAKALFRLTPNTTDPNARFAVYIDQPGAVWIDLAVLMDGDRFGGLPLRRDIVQGLIDERLRFLRYGGTMVNMPDYRWKNMIGDPDLRPQYRGNWYPYSTNGFGIFDFLNFCEAAKFDAAFAINIEETPQDAADLADYLTAPMNTPWGRRRAADGHPAPYHPEYIEIGNEEGIGPGEPGVMAHYAERFRFLSAAIHRRNPNLKLVCAAWWVPDAPSMKTVFDAIDGVATAWDIHVGSDEANAGTSIDRDIDQVQALFHSWNPKTNLKVVVFEENGGLHNQQRALGHATTLNATRRHGDFVLADCPANCLQPWGQNDNGWDQGQLFFTPAHIWAMPPYDAQRMLSTDYLPLRVASTGGAGLDVLATRSEDGRTVALTIVNTGARPVGSKISLGQFKPRSVEAWTLTGQLGDENPPSGPKKVVPRKIRLDPNTAEFPPYSLTTVRLYSR